jgi:hypothetical protein
MCCHWLGGGDALALRSGGSRRASIAFVIPFVPGLFAMLRLVGNVCKTHQERASRVAFEARASA